jgi:hypothetical protein
VSAISQYLRSAGGDGRYELVFWCPGCNRAHAVAVQRPADQPGPTWGWNGNPHKPTFTPSIFVKTVHHDMTDADWAAYDAAMAQGGGSEAVLNDPRFKFWCHSFVADGRIQFLTDSSHALAGQTVNLPIYPMADNREFTSNADHD